MAGQLVQFLEDRAQMLRDMLHPATPVVHGRIGWWRRQVDEHLAEQLSQPLEIGATGLASSLLPPADRLTLDANTLSKGDLTQAS